MLENADENVNWSNHPGIPSDRAVPLLGMYPRKMYAYMYKKACIRISIEAPAIVTQI